MAMRSLPGVRLRGAGEDASTAVQGAPAVHRGAQSCPTPPQAAAVPRPPPGTGEVLGDVQTFTAEAPRADVQAPYAAVARHGGRRAPDGRRRPQRRRLVRGYRRGLASMRARHIARETARSAGWP